MQEIERGDLKGITLTLCGEFIADWIYNTPELLIEARVPRVGGNVTGQIP